MESITFNIILPSKYPCTCQMPDLGLRQSLTGAGVPGLGRLPSQSAQGVAFVCSHPHARAIAARNRASLFTFALGSKLRSSFCTAVTFMIS